MSNSIQSHSVGRSQTLSNFQVRHYCQTRSKVRVIHRSQTWPNYNCQTWLKFLVLLPIAVTFLLPHKNGSNKTSCRLLVRFRGKRAASIFGEVQEVFLEYPTRIQSPQTLLKLQIMQNYTYIYDTSSCNGQQ